MLAKFVQLKKTNNFPPRFLLEEIFVNSEHVVLLREDFMAKRWLEDNLLPEDLDKRQQFTKLFIGQGSNAQCITVIGSPSNVSDKVTHENKQLLRG